MSKENFYAHSGQKSDHSDWQKLEDHLKQVALLAQQRADIFGGQHSAYLVGLLHDLGKYSQQFQRRLHGAEAKADHATAGAKLLMERWGKQAPWIKLLAFAVAGHHAGLANGRDEGRGRSRNEGRGRSTLEQRLALKFDDSKGLPILNEVWQQELALPESVDPPRLKPHEGKKYQGFGLAFFARMVFSCLIDADRLDTQNHARRVQGQAPLEHHHPSMAQLHEQLQRYLSALEQTAAPSSVNQLRSHILDRAQQQAVLPPGLFSLTVPTGGGKTLTSLAFGLSHALEHQLRRVIYVIPFTSVIEQTANVFRTALAEHSHAVLEHHSAFDRNKLKAEPVQSRRLDHKDKLHLAMESWDAPVVVTTAVQFFESLFSDRPTQCRKLHNIAGSVIVLDEAQTLPLGLLRPIMAAIEELVLNYRCSVVLCTATQPALTAQDGFHNGFVGVREIAPHPEELFQQLRRAQVAFLGEQSDRQLVEHLCRHQQVLMIVNNRRHARALFGAIANEPGAYHLSTAMCAEHRSKKLEEVRQCLKAGQPCRLVATSLIEAGVDVDFPVVYRAEAGLDSIAQAAGRCNREGKSSLEESTVFVFQSPEWKAPTELAQLAAPMRSIFHNHQGDLLAPEALKKYFAQVYWSKADELDKKGILEMHCETGDFDYSFQNIADAFQMIESQQLPIIVRYGKAQEILEQLHHLPEHDSVGKIARDLQRYVVQVPENAFKRLLENNAIEVIAPEKFGTQFYVIKKHVWYSEKAGLDWNNPEWRDAESLVL